MVWGYKPSSRFILLVLGGILIIFVLLFTYFRQSSDLSIKVVSISRTEEDSTEIRALIESNQDLDDVSVKILLPQTISSTDDRLNYKMNLKSHQPEELTLSVKGIKEGKGLVKLMVVASNDLQLSRAETSLSTYVAPSLEIFMTEDEWVAQETARMNDREWVDRYYRICDVGCYVPEPLKGEELNQYFKSLHLTEDYTYVMIQFDVLGADPSPTQITTLEKDGIIILESAFRKTLYAKAPVKLLETKSYDFVRWMGIMSADGKIDESLRRGLNLTCSNCTVDVSVYFYEDINSEQLNALQESSGIEVVSNYHNSLDGLVSRSNIAKISSFYFVKKIEPHSLSTLDMHLSLPIVVRSSNLFIAT